MDNEKKYLNNEYQLYGTRHYRLMDGFAKDVYCIDAKTAKGLEFTAVCDRGLDISLFSYKGMNLTFLARQGEVAPAYYDSQGAGWLRSFFGGLMTTCGPMNIGKASQGYGLHDRFSNTPATNVCDESHYGEDILIKGTVDTGILGNPKIRLYREIRANKHSAKITVTDTIENYGFSDSPLCFLYHTNYGYPLLDENADIFIDSSYQEPYDEYSKQTMDVMMQMQPPSPENKEKNYFHTMNTGGKYKAYVANREKGIGVFINFSDNMPLLCHCRFENPGDYFLAIEPGNTLCSGRDEIEKRGLTKIIKAGEKQVFTVSFEVLEGEEMLAALK